MKIIHKRYCTRCKAVDVPLVKNNRNKTKNGYTQYYYCRLCTAERTKKYYHNNKERVRAIIYKSIVKHQQKQNARLKLNYAVRTGKIERPSTCSECNQSGVQIEAHHENYKKPLQVIWLCKGCHADAEKS